MSEYSTRPIKEIHLLEFKEFYRGKILEVAAHAHDHIDRYERNVFKPEELILRIRRETPRKVFLQENGRYSVYFRTKEGYLELIISIESAKAVIISFMEQDELPRIGENDHEIP
jgi:hypothetical protein